MGNIMKSGRMIEDEIARSKQELSNRREAGNKLIDEIIELLNNQELFLFYADDDKKRKLLKIIEKECSM